MLSEAELQVFDFFRVFSRFEYALKETRRWVTNPQREFEPTPGWDAVANGIEPHLARLKRDPSFLTAWTYLLEHSPRRQLVRDGVLTWDPVTRNHEGEATFVFVGIRRVRNNLFHGGKSIPGTERDQRLIVSALRVLRTALEEHPEIKRVFDEYGPVE